MTNENVISLNPKESDDEGQEEYAYEDWLNWIECELTDHGFIISQIDNDWRSSFDKGLSPKDAVEEFVENYEKPGAQRS